MPIPNADKAIISPEKLRDYLLNLGHRRGSSKARILQSCGYRADDWHLLEVDLRRQHLPLEPAETKESPYGQRFEIRAPIKTPSGRMVIFESIWQIDLGLAIPRFITMYPR